MGSSIPQIALYVLGTGIFGAVLGWLTQGVVSKRRFARMTGEIQTKLDITTRQRDQFVTEFTKSQSTIKSLQAAVTKGRTNLNAVLEKSKLLAKNVRTLRAEREDTKVKISTIQDALVAVKQQTVELQTEFDKASEFYKGELVKSLEKRKVLEEKVDAARLEQESFAKLVESSILEHGSGENMIAAAQVRFGQLHVLERNVDKLETENAQLSADVIRMKQEYQALERDLAELEQLRIHNKQLVRCAETLESSRKQHEIDAERYRDQAGQSEQLSETLRLKLDDLEKSFADIEMQQHQALKHARKAAVVPIQAPKHHVQRK